VATFDYNPITGQLDLVGGGASYIDGVVADSSLLPVTLGTPALDAVYLAKAGSGVWLINRKPAGLYVRVANNGVAADWTYLGAFPEVNSSANWSLYDGTTPSKELKFDLSAISTSTVRTLTVPDASGTLARTEDFAAPPAIGNTTPAAGTFTTLTASTSLALTGGIITGASNVIEQVSSTSAQTFRIYNTFTSATNHERGFLKWSSNVFQIGTEKGSGSPGGTARALEFQTDGVTRMTLGSAGEIGFFGTAAAAQPAAIADATDAATTQARLNDLLAAMRTLGLIDT
jgi:hypothetical protein